jgi:4-azaleucine resistance transporter AzlC
MQNRTIIAPESISSDIKIMSKAIVDIFPLALATVPWGVLCGSLAINVGLTPLQAQLMSLLIFAGAAQLAALTIMAATGSLSSMFSSTFVISSRHLLYSAVFREHVRKSSLGLRCSIAFFLTDEMFAVTCAYMEKNKKFSPVYALSSGITFYVMWNISTFSGIVAGQHIPNLEHLGLEFAIAATFIAIVIPTIKNRSVLISVVTSALSAIILSIFMKEYALITATIIGMLCGYLTKDKQKLNE